MQKRRYRKRSKNVLPSRSSNGFPHVIRRQPFWLRGFITLRIENEPDYGPDDLVFRQTWIINHNKRRVVVRDYYYNEEKWELILKNGETISFWGGKCLFCSKKIDSKLLFKVLKLFFADDPSIRSIVPDFLIPVNKYKNFLKGLKMIQKTVSTIKG